MSDMRARGWCRQGGIMGVRPGDGGTIVAVSGDVDVCTEAPLRQALLRIIRERGARLMVDVSGVSFIDCAGLRALLATRRRAELRGGFMRLIATSAAVRRIIELTGTHEPLATERSTNQRIADQLFISTHTVAFHLRQVFCKLGIRSRVDLARIALEHARPETTQTP